MTSRRAWILGALVFLVFAAAAFGMARAARATSPTGDLAVIESYTIQAVHGRLLVGPYSRFQWHHPGPIYFYALAPFYAATGGRTSGLASAAAIINIATIAVAVWIAASAGGILCGGVVAASLAVYVLRVPDLLTSAWNPHVVVLPLVVAVLSAAAAAAGRPWMLPVAAGAATFAGQTHVGTLPTGFMLCALALAAVLAQPRTGRESRWRPIGATGIVVAIAWLPSFIEQAVHTPGNFTALWTFFTSASGHGQPIRTAFLHWANMLSGMTSPGFYLAHGWVLRATRSSTAQAVAIGEMVLLLVTTAVAFRARRRFEGFLGALLLLASLLALWSVTRVEGDVMDHEIFWISALGALNVAAIVAGALRALWPQERVAPAAAQAAMAIALIVCAASALGRLNAIRLDSLSRGPEGDAVARAAAAIRDYLPREATARPFIDIDQGSWSLAAGVLLQLQKSGVPYAVDDDWLPMFTDVARRTGAERLELSVSGAARHVVLRGRPGVVPVFESDPVFVDAYRFNSNK